MAVVRVRYLALLITLAVGWGLSFCVTRAGAQAGSDQAKVSQELEAIYKADQGDRESFGKLTAEELRAVDERDRQRRARVLEIVGKGHLHSAQDYFHAAMVFQHGDTPEEYLRAHELATVAGFKGHKSGRWLSAASLDRFLHAIGRAQRFGTQYRRDGNGPWTQEPYDRSMHDVVRKEYDVPPMADQQEPLDRLNRKS